MIHRIVALALSLVLLASPAVAGKRKVLVLPLDGNAPAETRTKLSASFQKMARVLDGDVQPGNTSLNDTATAIGCDPAMAACLENVRTTLGVDELVYGTADEDGGKIVVVAKRYQKGKDVRELTVTQPASEQPSAIEPQLLPVFGSEPLPSNPTTPVENTTVTTPAEPVAPVQPETPETPEGASHKRERNIAIGVTAGGGVLVLLGLALWQQASGLQDDINNAMPRDQADIDALKATEDKATNRAWAGNVCVVLGAGVAGYGVYRLWRWSRKSSVTVTPTPTDGGAAVFVGGHW